MKHKPKPQKRSPIITFEMGDDNEAIALAKLGLSNRAIKERTKLNDNQITYRLSKAKRIEQNEFGYRVDYRNGSSPMAMQIIHDIAGILREEVRRTITPKIVRPTPETVKIN